MHTHRLLCTADTAFKYLRHGSAVSFIHRVSFAQTYWGVSLFYASSFLTSSAAADETQVVETGHLVLDGSRGVSELGRIILIVTGHHSDQCAVRDVAEGNHLSINEWARYVTLLHQNSILETIQEYKFDNYHTMLQWKVWWIVKKSRTKKTTINKIIKNNISLFEYILKYN